LKKAVLAVLAVILIISLLGCGSAANKPQPEPQQNEGSSDEKAVTELVESFGKKLQMVSLTAPGDVLEKSMQENYGSFVSPELIKKWAADPLNAPGRLTSSPWPDRIEVTDIEKIYDNEYKVKGEIIEITSVEEISGGAAARRAITLVVKKADDRWIIEGVVL